MTHSALMKSLLLLITGVLVAITAPVHAACTSPEGVESQSHYDFVTHKKYYCNGSTWVDVAPPPAIAPPTGCTTGQIPSFQGGAWVCDNDESGGDYTGPLASGSKTGMDCSASGGTPFEISPGAYTCYFPRNQLVETVIFFIPTDIWSCPSGWSAHNDYSKTTAKTCTGGSCGAPTACTTAAHAFSDVARETCTYRYNSDGCKNGSCKATLDAMGCI
jgi:hypothetical protein